MKKIFYIVASILVALGGFYNFIYIPKTTYETVLIKKDTFTKDIFATGTIDSEITYQISSNATGRVSNILVKEGQMIKAGQTLALIDGVDLEDKIKEEEYSISKAISNKDASENKIEEAKAKYELATTQLKRYEKLHKDGFVSELELDNTKLSQISAKATMDGLKNDQISLGKEIKRLEFSLQGTKEKLQNLVLKAPSSGILVKKDIEIGDTAVAGKVLFKIVNPKDVWIKAFVDEAVSGEILVGQFALISIRSKQNESIKGFVKNINFVSDSVTEERELGIGFKDIPKQFFLNEQAEVKITVQTYKNVLLCDAKNIIKQENKTGIWSYKNGVAFFIPIKILVRSATSNFVVIDGNITENDIVIVPSENKKTLKNGASVRI